MSRHSFGSAMRLLWRAMIPLSLVTTTAALVFSVIVGDSLAAGGWACALLWSSLYWSEH